MCPIKYFIFFLLILLGGCESLNLTIPDPIPSGECKTLSEEFVESYNSMSTCFINNAPSGEYCLQCKPNLRFLQDIFHKLRHVHQEHSNTSCYDVLCRQNNIGIVCSDYKYIHHIWDESNCDYCYINNSISSDFLKPDVSVYISLVRNISECFQREKNVCVDCKESYRELSRMFFHEWYAWSSTGSYKCRDIYDKYNVTMREWNEVYGCIRESAESYLYPYIFLFSYIVILYFSFYFLVIYILPRQNYIKLGHLQSRTEVLPIDIAIRELRSEESFRELMAELSEDEVREQSSCPCFKRLTEFVQEYRDARDEYRSEAQPDPRIVASIHKKYQNAIHASNNFRI